MFAELIWGSFLAAVGFFGPAFKFHPAKCVILVLTQSAGSHEIENSLLSASQNFSTGHGLETETLRLDRDFIGDHRHLWKYLRPQTDDRRPTTDKQTTDKQTADKQTADKQTADGRQVDNHQKTIRPFEHPHVHTSTRPHFHTSTRPHNLIMDTIFLDPEYIPGTVQIIGQHDDDSMLIKDEKGTVLLPQPTSSPNDPLKWSWSRKLWHTLLVCFITGFTAATSNDSGAASDGLLEELGVGYDVQNTAAGVLFLGIGYWCLFISPLGSLYGRRLPYLLGCILGLIGALWFGRIKNVGDLICSQLFVGASEAVAEAYSQVSLIDIFHDHQSGSAIGIYVFATSIGTFLGPLIAGYIQIGQSWRWVGWWALIIGGGMTLCFWFGFEESYFPRNLVTASERGQTTLDDTNEAPLGAKGSEKLDSKDDSIPDRASSGEGSLYEVRSAIHPAATTESTNVQTNPKVIGWRDTQRSFRQRIQIITPAPNLKGWGIKQYFQRLWTTMKVFGYPAVIYSGLQWGAQDAWLSFYLTTQEDTYGEPPYNYSPTRIAVMKVPLIIGASIGCFYGGYLSDKFVHWMASRPARNGIREAEDRLWMMLLNCIISPLGMYLFGIGTGEMWSWPVVYVGLGFIGFGWGCAGDMSMSYLVDAYPEMVLEGMVGVSVINNSMGSIFTFVCDMWMDAQGITDTYITTGSICAGILFLTIPMIIFGKYFRKKTTKQYLAFLRERDSLDE
ncbi:uncharacterized protein YALI1_D32619g [Yarrowia lipolytica]|uniref:Major facilitator superfamily (MFS) profile domain-containing protein n=1 Tax=Yarrowia lipolytica TaxID=4952 RepID=A0A1D8NG32_YARLL|nr:hypothetical protein YALI1_D32619g [Yarrowia lipolytica]